MNANFWRVKEIFLAALEKPGAAERDAYLGEACWQDENLRRQVDALLDKHAQAGSFLEPPARSPAVTATEPATLEQPDPVIGVYKVMEEIGEGGFGVVYMAEQQAPVRRNVALKILKPGMDTRQVVARFEAERQALAIMDHPNIAKVLDAGTTGVRSQASGVKGRESGDRGQESVGASLTPGPCLLTPDPCLLTPDPCLLTPELGRPYFVMELVKGEPITEYCDVHRLSIRQRLELFVTVCQAVQHAHQKGLIHRDLKPSNILVASHDGTPVPKVIDFGTAKAMSGSLTDKTVFTGFAQMIGTPLYMSPEQAGQSDLDVDTRSDIYSLGVLLYELLTGATPCEKDQLSKLSYDELRRIICETEPPKPSTRFSTVGQAATTASTNRQSDPRRLSQQIRGELDWIVMKALEKDRNRRYES